MFCTQQKTQPGPHGINRVGRVHQLVAEQQVHHGGNGVKRHVLGEDFGGIFCSYQARLEHGEARCHPHNQRATKQEIKGIQRVSKIQYIFHCVILYLNCGTARFAGSDSNDVLQLSDKNFAIADFSGIGGLGDCIHYRFLAGIVHGDFQFDLG